MKTHSDYVDMTHPVLALAEEEARALNHPFVGAEHLVLALLRDGDSTACRSLQSAGVTHAAFRDMVLDSVGRGTLPIEGHIGQTPRVQRILELAAGKAERLDADAGDPQLLLHTLLDDGGGLATRILSSMGIDMDQLAEEMSDGLCAPQGSASGTSPVREHPLSEGVLSQWATFSPRENSLARATSSLRRRRAPVSAPPRHDS